MAFGSHLGVVDSFDADAGLGEVVDDQGRRWQFHCTTIADGSRSIAVGTKVGFALSAGGPGRWEASRVIAAS